MLCVARPRGCYFIFWVGHTTSLDMLILNQSIAIEVPGLDTQIESCIPVKYNMATIPSFYRVSWTHLDLSTRLIEGHTGGPCMKY